MEQPKQRADLSLDGAIERVSSIFPFEGYTAMLRDTYVTVASTVSRHLPRGAKVLDFGCGPCDKIAVLQAMGYVCAGCDDWQDPWHQVKANREKIQAFIHEAGVQFARMTEAPLPFARESFDMVMTHDVLEHLHNSPREVLTDLLELVAPGGFFFATVPNAVNIRKRIAVLRGRTNLAPFEDYYWTQGAWRGHIREYTKNDFVQLAEFLGLEILELRGCHHMLRKLPAAARPLYLTITGIFPGWRDTWLLVARKRPGWTPRRSLSPEERIRLFGGDHHPAVYSVG